MKRIFKALLVTYGIYLALCMLVVTPLLNVVPPWLVAKHLQRELSTELVVFNPFSLGLEIRKASLSEPDGSSFASLDRAALNLSTSGLWQAGWILDELAIEGVDVALKRYRDGSLNISSLAPPGDENTAAPPATETTTAELPGMTVRKLRLSAHRIAVSDAAREEAYSTHWDNLHLQLDNLSTVSEPGDSQHLRLSDEDRGGLSWDGEISLPNSRSQGRIELDSLSLRPGWRFVKEQVDFELSGARLSASLDYTVDWSGELAYSVSNGQLALTNTRLRPAVGIALADTGIDLASLTIADIAVDGASETLSIGAIDIDGLDIQGWLEDERVSLVDMFNTRFPASDAPSEPSPWQISLNQANVNAARIRWQTPFTRPALLDIQPLDLKVSDIHWPPRAASPVVLALTINDTVQAGVEASYHLGDGDGEASYRLEGLPLPWFEPNMPAALNAHINSGSAAVTGTLTLAANTPRIITATGAISDLALQLFDDEQSLTSWRALAWNDLNVDLPAQHIELGRLNLDGYSGRVHIRRDGTLNIQHVMREQEAEAEAAATTAVAEAGDTDTKPWTFSVPDIVISEAQVDYMDESLPIHFRSVVGDLNGTIKGLDSDPDKSLAVDLKGSVDGYAPVKLKGTASPLHTPPAIDLNLTFQGVDLARLTPYSGTYAGYAISRGTLNLDLDYSLDDNRLKGDNSVVIDQLKLGEKIDSDKAVDLPLQLGIALLTDANGVIDLAVPVSGNVDDPKFSLSGVIWGAFGNLITKAVTAPFRLLANLADSDDDLQHIAFVAGSTSTDEVAQTKLHELADALNQRPQLTLVLSGRFNPESDAEKLRSQLFEQQLLASGLSESDISARSEAWQQAVAARYQQLAQNGEEASPPPLPVQAQAVSAQITLPADALKMLAEERAASAKRFLVNEAGIPADRAVIERSNAGAEGNTFSGVEMSIEL